MPNESPIGPPWTISKLLEWTTDFFSSRISDNPRIDAEILLAHTLHCRRLDLYLQYEKPLNNLELAEFRQLVQRRGHREPIAYITGKKEFWSLGLEVTPDVLIPRPDTELLVEIVLEYYNRELKGDRKINALELGIGSGAISIALAKECKYFKIIATDVAPQVLAIAARNIKEHKVDKQIQLVAGNWFDPLKSRTDGFDVIVSNPPYIPSNEVLQLSPDIVNFEPHLALDGGDNGTDCHIKIISSAHQFLNPGGCLFLEIGFDQKAALQAYLSENKDYIDYSFNKDYAGHYRVVRLIKGKEN